MSRINWVYTSGGWSVEERDDTRDVILHLVRGGKTLCGLFSSDLEDNYSTRHRWTETRADDAHLANCASCKKRRPP